MSEKTPWSAWLAHALTVFGFAPDTFWRLSLREWRALNAPASAPMTKQDFAALASRYPD